MRKTTMMLAAMLMTVVAANAQDINADSRHRGGAAVDKSGDKVLFIPKVNIDNKEALARLKTIAGNHPVAIELSFTDDKNLAKAVNIVKGRARILINTSSDGCPATIRMSPCTAI